MEDTKSLGKGHNKPTLRALYKAQQKRAREMVEGKKRTIFAVLNHEAGRGPARLRRLVWDQEIAGSNPAAPTTKAVHTVSGFFVRESESLLSSVSLSSSEKKLSVL